MTLSPKPRLTIARARSTARSGCSPSRCPRSSTEASPYTDITGGLLQAIEFLNEKGTGRKTILIFSDLKEDLEEGYVRDLSLELDGFEVVALNVTKLRSDNVDPREYLGRLEDWRTRVEKSGGQWRVINDLDGLEGLL